MPRIFAAAPKGTEDLLSQEVERICDQQARIVSSGVQFDGSLINAYDLCLWSHIASRVVIIISEGEAGTKEDLYKHCYREIAWDQHFSCENSFAIHVSGKNYALRNSQFTGQVIKDAIVDQFREKFGKRPSVSKQNPDLRIQAYINKETVQVGISLSHTGLHERGYRIHSHPAPLKENLAAAMLYRANWPKLAKQGAALIDPMCGSGTLAIEAALMALNWPPGFFRNKWSFHGWQKHDPQSWQQCIQNAKQLKERSEQSATLCIKASDIHPQSVYAAKQNTASIGLDRFIHIFERDVLKLANPFPKDQTGLIITNPPYGKRLDERTELHDFYADLGIKLKQEFPHWRFSIISDDRQHLHQLGLKTFKTNKLYNGPIQCNLFHIELSPARQDSGSRLAQEPNERHLSQELLNRLKKNQKALKAWRKTEGISCYRLYDADLPQYAVAIDVFEDKWAHVQEYTAPKSVPKAHVLERRTQIKHTVPYMLNIPKSDVFYKQRFQQKGNTQYQKQAQEQRFELIREHGAQFLVNFTDYLDVGIFLDHRPLRQWIKEQANGRRFLNLYCYTATASVMAALGGAKTTTSVDASKTYLAWAEQNFLQNKLELRPKHEFIQADCMEWLQSNTKTFDLIFIDPPTFSNSKSRQTIFDIQKDHEALLRAAMQHLSKNGELYFSNNFKDFQLSPSLAHDFNLTDLQQKSLPKDFSRNQKVHHLWMFMHK